MSTSTPTPVTVVGLGLMGRALAAAFLKAGHPTTVWNRTAAKADQLVADGATFTDSLADATTASPLVIVCVTDYNAVRALFDPLDGALSGRTVVNLTSGTSQGAREAAEWATGLGAAAYLDGAILAVPDEIGGDAVVVYSGPRAAFDQHEATLRVLGAGAAYLDADHGLASLYDASVLTLMWSVLNGFLQGVALLGTAGVDAGTYAPFAKESIGTMADWLAGMAQQVDDGAYPAVDATVDTHAAAMEHLVEEADAVGVNAELPRFFQEFAARAVTAGRGGDGYAALIEQFRKRA